MLHSGCVIILYAGFYIHTLKLCSNAFKNPEDNHVQKSTHLDVQGRAEKTCSSRLEDVKDVGSSFILELFFNHDGTSRMDVFSTVKRRSNVCWDVNCISACSQTLAYSCSEDGSVIVWDVSTLQVRRQFRVSCHRLQSVQIHTGMLWCCGGDCVLEVRRNGTVLRKVSLPDHLLGSPRGFSCFLLFNESEQLWTGLADAGELCVCDCRDLNKPFIRIQLKDCTAVVCMIRVKNQIWVGCQGKTRGKIYVVNTERYTVEKELMAHDDSVQTLCSAEDRYVLSGAARADGKIGIWKVE